MYPCADPLPPSLPSGTLRQKLEAIAAARFDGIELFQPDFISFTGSARELRRQAADLGLGIDLYQPFAT